MWFLTKPENPPRPHHRNTDVPPVALAWGSYGQGVGDPWEILEVPLGYRLQFPDPSLEIAQNPHGALITP